MIPDEVEPGKGHEGGELLNELERFKHNVCRSLAGSTRRACAVSRRRLSTLYRACGFQPHDGDALRPADLVGSKLEIRLGHETYDGTLRLRVLGYPTLP